MEIETSYISKSGGRDKNQDDVGYRENGRAGCWIIADGLGGHRGGELASTLTVESVLKSFQKRPDLEDEIIESRLRRAHEALRKAQEKQPEYSSMGTTVVALIRNGEEATWAHVGDARLYHFREGKIRFQTKDHSVPQTMAAAGDISSNEIRSHEDRDRLLRVVGENRELRPEIGPEVKLEDGDAFLLCTDGFWEYVTESDMKACLNESSSTNTWLNKMEEILRSRTAENSDNYSALALSIKNRA